MENQPTQPLTTGRQWFRLASMARLESLRQAPAPAPNQTTIAPAPAPASTTVAPPRPAQAAFPRIPLPRLSSERFPGQPQPPQPAIQQAQQALPSTTANGAPPPLPAVSSQPAVSQTLQSPPPPPPSPRPRVPSREPTPPQSPKVVKPSSPIRPESPKIQQLQPIKTPPDSPKIRQLQPIKTPPPYPEPEPKPPSSPSPKSTFTKPGNSDERVNRSHVGERAPSPSPKKETAPNETGIATTWKKKVDNGEVKIITMAGENTGAYMELGSLHGQHANRKQQYGHQLQYHRTTSNSESQSEDGKSEDKNKDKGKKSAAEGKPIAALVNSNVQSINNSILFRSSSTKQSPGVHFTLVSQRHTKHRGSTHQ